MRTDLTDMNARGHAVAYRVVGQMADRLPPEITAKLTKEIATEVFLMMQAFVNGDPMPD